MPNGKAKHANRANREFFAKYKSLEFSPEYKRGQQIEYKAV